VLDKTVFPPVHLTGIGAGGLVIVFGCVIKSRIAWQQLRSERIISG
jgi:hypothetical protein